MLVEKPDFEALKRRRDCYCACPDGPCQHEWDGPWEEFEDGCGGQATCQLCGAGAMHHDIRVSE